LAIAPWVVVSARGSPTTISSAARLAIDSTSESSARGTIMRVGALHDWPRLRKAAATPSETARSRSASGRITFGDLPPSSCATRLTVGAAASATATPARVEPVIEIMSTSGWDARPAPTVGPSPLTRLKTPAGKPASSIASAKRRALKGRKLARLQHDRAACGERRRDLGGDLVERPVPRRDQRADPDRLATSHGASPQSSVTSIRTKTPS
jgi:hypothetical protein